MEVERNRVSVGKQLLTRVRALSHPNIRRDFSFPRSSERSPRLDPHWLWWVTCLSLIQSREGGSSDLIGQAWVT